MDLSELIQNSLGHVRSKFPLQGITIEGITANSKEVCKNDLFVAISGYHHDGHDYIRHAIECGAAAVVGEKYVGELSVPYIRTSNSRSALAKLAKEYYQTFTSGQTVIGVTGTNGKTTTCFMLRHIFEASGFSCALFSTLFNIVNGEKVPSEQTTSDPLKMHHLLSRSKDQIIIVEVSSHGLSQCRLDGIDFDCCVFTNLDHDHLDYHQNMEDYFSVKASLFNKLKNRGKAVINGYDSWGEKLIQSLEHTDKQMYVMGEGGHSFQIIPQYDLSSETSFFIDQGKRYPIQQKIPGVHNILNAGLAYLTAKSFHIPEAFVIHTLQNFEGIPGRFQITRQTGQPTIVIDYAHTADAFYHCLQTGHAHKATRIFHVFGFRGDRDISKRKRMVEISSLLSDKVILTTDDLNQISHDAMVKSLHEFSRLDNVQIIPDRTLAIEFAITSAREGDWVFITGKGHERYKESYKLPSSSDLETVRMIQQLVDSESGERCFQLKCWDETDEKPMFH
ncbi:UDP-N-acetylmuramoyl-L-alanyl-D-glutamate--2,6-diaminopimelate ligase [Siminovitchia sediminis]|uniref:UDP-N-acetylmuramoyl-L-alanyl-D-glutamate--2, 6-diaminopimelate ligase n=1 Tax=Siminovitchia sediminis TaxID=1274353 RepID=A0ABW4KHR5_9BACI